MIDLAVWLVAAATTASFHPPLGVPLSYVSRADRTIGGKTAHFESRRRITFTREGDGFIATIVFERASNDAGGDVAAMFDSAMASFADRRIALHLDAAGAVTAVEDSEGLWTALCDAIAALPGDAGQRARAARFAGALRALPPPQREKMLGSLVEPLIAGADAGLVPSGPEPVTLPARPPAPAGTALPGTQTVTRDSRGMLDIHISASGDVAAADGTTAHVVTDRNRVIDPATGLVLAARDHRTTTIGGDEMTADTNVTLTLPVS